MPINVVFFRHFEDNGATYLARSWLVEHETASASTKVAGQSRTREIWNGHDWYVAFGEEAGERSWNDARRYGFVSGGGGMWFSRTLKNLPIGARVFVHIPKTGYVGVGTVSGEARRFDETEVEHDGRAMRLTDLPLEGRYRDEGDDEDDREWAVPIDWIHTVQREQAFWRTGMFANQNTATRLRQKFTIEQASEAFGLNE